MAHPKETKIINRVKWHLEDSNLLLDEARSLKKHLIFTEGKRAKIVSSGRRNEVWWAKGVK